MATYHNTDTGIINIHLPNRNNPYMQKLLSLFLTQILTLFTAMCIASPSSSTRNDTTIARQTLRKGNACLQRSDYNTALSCFLKYIQMEESTPHKDTIALLNTYYNIGGIYSVYQDFAQALDIYESGFRLSKAAKNAQMQFKFLNNMIGASCNIGKTNHAEQLNKMVKELRGVDYGTLLFYYYFNNGFISGSRDKQDEKIMWMKKAIATANAYHLSKQLKVYPYSEIYQSYEKRGQLQNALDALLKYDTLAHDINRQSSGTHDSNAFAYLLADCYKGLMRIYTKMGNKEKALYYQNEFFRYNDSLLNINEYSKIKNQHLNYENRQTQLIISSQQKTILYQKVCLVMLAILVVTAVAAIIIIKRQRKVLYDTNIALFDRNNELVEAKNDTVPAPSLHTPNDTTVPAKAAPVNEKLVQSIRDALKDERNFCDPEFSLSVLAQIVGSNTNYVSQAINSAFNKNFRTLLNEHRIKEAMRRMKDNTEYRNYSIQGISESVGFKSASNFIAAFKKMTGMTPSLYQKLSKNE